MAISIGYKYWNELPNYIIIKSLWNIQFRAPRYFLLQHLSPILISNTYRQYCSSVLINNTDLQYFSPILSTKKKWLDLPILILIFILTLISIFYSQKMNFSHQKEKKFIEDTNIISMKHYSQHVYFTFT